MYQGVLIRKIDCLVISGAWMSRVLERASFSSLAEFRGSDLRSWVNFSLDMVSYFLKDFVMYGRSGLGELIVMKIV